MWNFSVRRGERELIEFIDKTSEKDGTDINRLNMMAIQGFIGNTITKNEDGSITEINDKGEILTTKKNEDGSITQIFTGEKTITKTIKFDSATSISEVIS